MRVVTMNDQTVRQGPGARRRRIRLAGLAILVCGFVAAWATYWWQTRAIDPLDAQMSVGARQAEDRQMAILYGPTGMTVLHWAGLVGEPEGEAGLVVLATVVASGICFRAAQFAED